MKKKKRPATYNGGTKKDEQQQLRDALMKGCSTKPVKEVQIPVYTRIATQIDDIGIDDFALDVLEMTTPEWVPLELQEEMKESLRGFSDWAALWIAESLTDCCRGDALATTGIPHIDNMLWTLYAKILNSARSLRIRIANHL